MSWFKRQSELEDLIASEGLTPSLSVAEILMLEDQGYAVDLKTGQLISDQTRVDTTVLGDFVAVTLGDDYSGQY